jgi:hypothetical protein
LPSVISLSALRKLAKGSRAPDLFIGFGDPILRGNLSCGKPSLPASCPRCSRPDRPARWLALRSDRHAVASSHADTGAHTELVHGNLADVEVLRAQCPLPETSFELKCVAQSLGVPESQIQVQEKATEIAVKKARLERYQIVHFAAHGLLAGETKQVTGSLAEPALVLTPPATPTEADDGLLTVSEIAQLKLNADWVVLSARNTAGAGDTTSGEALSGLARAFFYAGARCAARVPLGSRLGRGRATDGTRLCVGLGAAFLPRGKLGGLNQGEAFALPLEKPPDPRSRFEAIALIGIV